MCVYSPERSALAPKKLAMMHQDGGVRNLRYGYYTADSEFCQAFFNNFLNCSITP